MNCPVCSKPIPPGHSHVCPECWAKVPAQDRVLVYNMRARRQDLTSKIESIVRKLKAKRATA